MRELALHLLDIAENSVSAQARRVEIGVEEDAQRDRMRLWVKDDGKGMDDEMVARVTDPFVTTRTTRKVGLGIPLLQQDWLGRGPLAVGVVVFVVSWQYVPFHSLIYQGGVRQIPRSMYEAAELDGAGRVRQFVSITLPQLKYTIIASSTLMVIGSLTSFDLIFVLTEGGPADSTRTLALDMFKRGFQANLMGPASAIAVILVLVGLALALLMRRLGGGDNADSQLEGA